MFSGFPLMLKLLASPLVLSPIVAMSVPETKKRCAQPRRRPERFRFNDHRPSTSQDRCEEIDMYAALGILEQEPAVA